MKTIHVIVEGRVQGVSFRYYTHKQANRLHLSGWVRNKLDGTVEATFSGADSEVNSMLEWLRHGSPGSRVDNIHTMEIIPEEDFTTFEIRF
jgi:acylphosphatase